MYTFSELIWNSRKVGKIDSRKMQGQSAFTPDEGIHCTVTSENLYTFDIFSTYLNSPYDFI